MHVLLLGLDQRIEQQISREEGFEVSAAKHRADAKVVSTVDAIVVHLEGSPLETIRALRTTAPGAAVVVITDAAHETDGTVAMHAGAEDHLILDQMPEGLLPRAIRYAVAARRLRREVSTRDEATGLPNLRGFAAIAEHHLRMADRAGKPVVFVFGRLEGLAGVPPSEVDDRMRVAAEVLLEAVRSADVPARVAPDTFCVLLTGAAEGAESLVLSRLTEAIAAHAATGDSPWPLAVGSSLYAPESETTLGSILETAGRRLSAGSSDTT